MYYLIKQEKCEACVRVTTDAGDITSIQFCGAYNCSNGYIETRVDADEWLLDRLTELKNLGWAFENERVRLAKGEK